MFTYPVGVQLFNRPEYAEKFLLSLREQTLPLDQNILYIYIDGFKGSLYESRGLIDKTQAVEEVARAIFPHANIHRFKQNCGIADLHNRLQEVAFSENHPWAAFFEEDLILDQSYLQELSDLIEIVDDTDIVAKVACFQILPALAHLPRGYDGFYPGVGTKAFAERKSFYFEKRSVLEYFVELQSRTDIPQVEVIKGANFQRDPHRLSKLAGVKGLNTLNNFFEHDAVTDVFIQSSRKIHVVTKPNLATDIGVDGIHNSIHISPSYIPNQVVTPKDFNVRSAIFKSYVPQLTLETETALAETHFQILDGYFTSLSRKQMLKKIIRMTFRNLDFLDFKKTRG